MPKVLVSKRNKLVAATKAAQRQQPAEQTPEEREYVQNLYFFQRER